jgi:HTH-type transcriptional regulator/antitoxin HigA
MTTKSIRFEQEYLNALERLEAIFDARKGTSEGAELEQLGALIDDYETKHYPMEVSRKGKSNNLFSGFRKVAAL